MARVEVLYRADNAAGPPKDGNVLIVRPAGVTLTAQQMSDWFLGTEPSEIALLASSQPGKIAEVRRTIGEIVGFTDPNLNRSDVIANRLSHLADPETALDDMIADAEIRRDRTSTEGWDINWGREELKRFGVAIMDLPFHVIHDMQHRPMDPAVIPVHKRTLLAKFSMYAIPYANLLSGHSLDNLMDKTLPVPAARNAIPWQQSDLSVNTSLWE